MTLLSPQTLMMSGACPPPAPSVWTRMDRPALERGDRAFDEPAFVQGIGVDHDLHVHVVRDREAAVDRCGRCAPVFVQLQATRAGFDLLDQARGRLALPLPKMPKFIGNPSGASSIRWMCHGPGVQVVAFVPAAGPVPPPIMVVTPG